MAKADIEIGGSVYFVVGASEICGSRGWAGHVNFYGDGDGYDDNPFTIVRILPEIHNEHLCQFRHKRIGARRI